MGLTSQRLYSAPSTSKTMNQELKQEIQEQQQQARQARMLEKANILVQNHSVSRVVNLDGSQLFDSQKVVRSKVE